MECGVFCGKKGTPEDRELRMRGKMKNERSVEGVAEEGEQLFKALSCGRFRKAEEIVVGDGAAVLCKVELLDGDVFPA